MARVEQQNPALNAIIVTDLGRARQRADAALARGESWGALHGLPMTVKESFDVVGMPTTWGLTGLNDNFPTANALAVDRLPAATDVAQPTLARNASTRRLWANARSPPAVA